ncbi:uncharacterized protein TRIADDRAFT_58229 [Trichoplax adhaerens]|uniref:Uncharacterized protein n=1 Tax=Trichoplax adhaerens TaxID=10228 RepID=B3S179_TRIAD|nr:predicted protein [Trichoplax adhaerens]EDV23515.1 predicted protein [Trichoplax adhaerens]|eukprot:XP_002114425.1 predicted protein [Trichoplax adhaerens]
MQVQVELKSITNLGYAVNRCGTLRVDNVLAFIDSQIEQHFDRFNCHNESNVDDSELYNQRWILSSTDITLSPSFNRCQFGSSYDVLIKLESEKIASRYFTCRIWPSNKRKQDEQICFIKMIKVPMSPVEKFLLTNETVHGQEYRHIHNKQHNYSYSITIRPSDLDANQSIRLNNLLIFCQHAACHAMNDKKLKDINDLYDLLRIEHVQLHLMNVASYGDIKVYIWQTRDREDNNTLNFLLTQSSNHICRASIKLNSKVNAAIVPFGSVPIIYYEDNCRVVPTSHCSLYRDRFGNPHLNAFMRMIGDINTSMLHYEDLASLTQVSKGARYLTVRQNLHVHKHFFAIPPNAVLQHEVKVAAFGNTSFTFNQNVYHRSHCLLNVFTKIVCMFDGKLKVLPPWHKKRYRNLFNKVDLRKMNIPAEIPSKACKYRFESRFDDIDENFHTNQTVYLCNSLNAASHVVRNQLKAYHTDFGHDFNPSCLTDLQSNYYAESLEHQILDVFTWQDSEDNTLQFLIKHHQQDVFYMTATIRDDWMSFQPKL